MKFIVEKAALVAAMTRTTSIADKRQVIPILGNVLIESESPGFIRLRTSNLDMEVCEIATCDMLNEIGATTVPAHSLLDIARNAPEGAALKFELGDRLIVKYGRSRFQLSCLPAADFPALMTTDIPGSFAIPAQTLRDLFSRTAYAIASDGAMAHLQGVRLEVRGGELWAAATNYKALAMVKVPAPDGSDGLGVTVPEKMVDAAIRALAGVDDDVDVSFSDRKISIKVGTTIITSKILDGSFVNFPVKTEQPISVRIARDEMVAMINRVRTTTDKADGIKFDVADGSMSAHTRNMEGEGLDEIGAEFEGDAFSVGFGAKFILDVLASLTGDIVEMQFGPDGGAPVVVFAPSDPGTMINMGTQRV